MPTYETNITVSNEDKVVSFLEEKWADRGVTLHKLEKFHPADYLVANKKNEIVAVAEIKRRHMNHDQFDTQVIDYFKLCSIALIADLGDLPVLLIYWFNDGVYMARREPKSILEGQVRMGGRKDRGDAYDVKPVWHIPLSAFKKI